MFFVSESNLDAKLITTRKEEQWYLIIDNIFLGPPFKIISLPIWSPNFNDFVFGKSFLNVSLRKKVSYVKTNYSTRFPKLLVMEFLTNSVIFFVSS